MQVASLVLGILSIVGMLVAFIPCIGSLNWINIPFSGIGLIVGIVALAKSTDTSKKNMNIIGVICCGCAILFGLIRLLLGGGIL